MRFKTLFLMCFMAAASYGSWVGPAKAIETKSPENQNRIAVVNGADITARDFEVALNTFTQQAAMQMGRSLNETELSEIKTNLIEQMVNQELLYQAAKKHKTVLDEDEYRYRISQIEKQMNADPRFKAEIEKTKYSMDDIKKQIKQNLLVNQFLNDRFYTPAQVSKEEIKTYYDNHKAEFILPEQVRARHILIKPATADDEKSKAEAGKKIAMIKEKLKDNPDFEAMAKEYSQCPSSKQGGDLGFFGRGEMAPPFEHAAFSLAINETSDIVETQFGYHLIKVIGKRDQTAVPFEEAEPQIESTLKNVKASEGLEAFLVSEKKTGAIEVFTK